MAKFVIGRKSGMTQLFDENGNVIPATVIEVEPMYVLQNKTVETDGYKAVKVGSGAVREKLVNKPDKGQFAKAGVEVKKVIREFKTEEDYELGQEISSIIIYSTDDTESFYVEHETGKNSYLVDVQDPNSYSQLSLDAGKTYYIKMWVYVPDENKEYTITSNSVTIQ